MSQADEALEGVFFSLRAELKKKGFRGSKAFQSRELPEARNLIFLQKDRVSAEDEALEVRRFQVVHGVYLKVLDQFFRAGQKPQSFSTADADIHGVLGNEEPCATYMWWAAGPGIDNDQTKLELVSLIRELLPAMEQLSTMQNYFERDLRGWREGKLKSPNGMVKLLFVGKALRREDECRAVRNQLIQGDFPSAAPFIKTQLAVLDGTTFNP